MSDFWKEYEQATEQEGGGGGIVTKALIETGYKVYVSGLDQADTFFPAAPGDDAARKAAKSKAQALGKANWGIQIKAYRDTAVVRGRAATWQADRHFNTDSWTSAAKEVVVPSLRQAGIVLPWEGWCRIGFQPDPFKLEKGEVGMTDQDQDGNPRYPQVAYVTEVFADEEAARAAVSTPATADTSTIPFLPGDEKLSKKALEKKWTLESWQGMSDEINVAYAEAIKASDRPAPIARKEALQSVADHYDAAPSDVELLINPT